MDECREAFEKWAGPRGYSLNKAHNNDYTSQNTGSAYDGYCECWTARQTETIRHAYNAGVAWAIGNGKDIDEYLEAQK